MSEKQFKVARTTSIAIRRPRTIVWAMALIPILLVLGAGLPNVFPDAIGFLPQAHVDTDPENMLPADVPARVAHRANKKRFDLRDPLVLGIVNEKDPNGVFNPKTLAKVKELSDYAKTLDGVVAEDLLSLTTTDSIENAGPGTVKFDWLMKEVPQTQEEASAIRDRAMRMPVLNDTLVSADGKALFIYIFIEDKNDAYDLAEKMRAKFGPMRADGDRFYLAGLSLAQSQFAIQMFVEMLISPPITMCAIFLMMWFFFKRLSVVVAPMLVALASSITATALLLLAGQTIHIMSSLIPMFVFPIAVLDGVHILSDFFDTYPKTRDRKKAIAEVMGHLYRPMLFTSLTTAVGFAALALTPIPPIQTFGLFVAIGVLLAWFFTITFVPAYIMLLSPKRLEGFGMKKERLESGRGPLATLGRMGKGASRIVVLISFVLTAGSVYGILKIRANDNPTNWFDQEHEIRVADRALNKHFGGTYNAYLSLQYAAEPFTPQGFRQALVASAAREANATKTVFREFETAIQEAKATDMLDLIDELEQLTQERRAGDEDSARRIGWALVGDMLAEQFELADQAEDQEALEGPDVAPAKPEDSAKERLRAVTVEKSNTLQAIYATAGEASADIAAANPESQSAFATSMHDELRKGEELRSMVLGGLVDRESQANQVFKRPDVLHYVADLQAAMGAHALVGKSTSLAEIVKLVHRDLMTSDEKDYRIPNTFEAVGQTLLQYESSHRPGDQWHFVTKDYQNGNIWIQLVGGDNVDMQEVLAVVNNYLKEHAAPVELEAVWFGLTYVNVKWQEGLVSGMMKALYGSFAIVLLMMIFLFRSVAWGILSMIPLAVTVAVIYGIFGLIGKDYDAPIAMLTSMSLGLAIDYSIHFVARAQELQKLTGNWKDAQVLVFQEPARAIVRNVIVVGIGFLPLGLSRLTPYQSIGLVVAALLFVSGLASLLILPALVQVFKPWLFKSDGEAKDASDVLEQDKKESAAS